MDMSKQVEVWETISQMNTEELRQVINAVKTRQRVMSATMSGEFKIGDKVMFGRTRGAQHFGEVYKINRTKAIVDTGMSGKYSVPFSMIKLAK